MPWWSDVWCDAYWWIYTCLCPLLVAINPESGHLYWYMYHWIWVFVEDMCPQMIIYEGMYDQDQVIWLERWISVRKYTVQDRVATKTVNSCEEVYCPRPGKPSRAVIPCEVVHFPDQVIQRGTCRFWFRRELGCVWCSSESICYSRLWIFKFGFLCSMIIYWF